MTSLPAQDVFISRLKWRHSHSEPFVLRRFFFRVAGGGVTVEVLRKGWCPPQRTFLFPRGNLVKQTSSLNPHKKTAKFTNLWRARTLRMSSVIGWPKGREYLIQIKWQAAFCGRRKWQQRFYSPDVAYGYVLPRSIYIRCWSVLADFGSIKAKVQRS